MSASKELKKLNPNLRLNKCAEFYKKDDSTLARWYFENPNLFNAAIKHYAEAMKSAKA